MERASKLLYDWGFENADKVTPVEQLPSAGPRPQVQRRPALQVTQEGSPEGGQDELLAAVSAPVEEEPGGASSTVILLVALMAAGGAGYVVLRARRPRS